MNKRNLPPLLIIVAVFQVVAPLILPPSMYHSVAPPIWIALAVVFAFLGVNLLRLQGWARLATVFVQGFNVIVRLLTLLGNVKPSGAEGFDIPLLVTSLLSMGLSVLVLQLVERPDVQLIMR